MSRQIGLLRVKGRKMNLQKIPLKTVRQFFIQDVVLADYQDLFTPDTPHVTKKVENLCYAKVKVTTEDSDLIIINLRLNLLAPLLSPYILLCYSVGHRDVRRS